MNNIISKQNEWSSLIRDGFYTIAKFDIEATRLGF